MKLVLVILVALAILGCSPKEREGSDDSDIPPQQMALAIPTDAWLGEWRGVEGLHMSVDKDAVKGPGHYILVMRFGLDDKDSGIFNGLATGDTITFTRDGSEQVLRHTNGRAIGLKWLEEKTDCLIVKEGEGYCRD